MSKSADETGGLHILGQGTMPRPSHGPEKSILEAFPNRYQDRDYIISISFPEFTSLCPVTGQPDFGVICLEYIPDLLCVESKSFKLYMFAYREHQSFMETITNSILDDCVGLLQPRWCRVKGLFAPRGATRLHVYAEHFKELEASRMASVRRTVEDWRLENRGQ